MIPEGREILEKKCKLIYMTMTIGFQTFIIIIFWCLFNNSSHVGLDHYVMCRDEKWRLAFPLDYKYLLNNIAFNTLCALIGFFFFGNCMWRENVALKVLPLHYNFYGLYNNE